MAGGGKSRGKSRGGKARTAAIGVSAVLHLVLLALLVRYATRTAPVLVEPPAVQALLFPPARHSADRRDRVRPSASAGRDAGDRTRRKAWLAQALPLGEASPIAPGLALPPMEAGAGTDVAAGTRPLLKGLGGCERADLTRREREDCQARRFAGAAPANPRLNLDLAGRYARNPEPFLSRRPSKGCRARMAGDADGMGNDMNVRAGITCVKPF